MTSLTKWHALKSGRIAAAMKPGHNCRWPLHHGPRPLQRAQATHSPQGGQEKEFEVNFGRAVDCLREDLPQVLSHRLQHEDIYHPALVLDTPVLHLHSLSAYLWFLACIRLAVRVLFSQCTLDLTRLWSPSHGLVRARCSFIATPRGSGLWVLLNRLSGRVVGKPGHDDKLILQQDLLFTYGFSSKGLINLHKVETVVPLDPPKVVELVGAALVPPKVETIVPLSRGLSTGTRGRDP